MAIARSKKPAIFLTVIIFLMVGGAAAFFYVINSTTDPVVEADIDAHFAALENSDDDMPTFPENRAIEEPDILLFSSSGDAQRPQTGNTSKKFNRRKKRTVKKQNNAGTTLPQSKNGITKIASGTWLIEENTFRQAQKNIGKYVGSARAELAENEHGPIGFRLKNVKKKSYLREIGLRGNDVLVAINGHPLNSVENVTLAIASFQNATQFRLDLLRKDKKRSFYYKIVKD